MTEAPDKYPVKVTRKGIVIWSGLVLFAMGWMFVVGILVGRGMAPVPDHQAALQQELETLKNEKLAEERAKIEAQDKLNQEKGPHLPFYDELKKPSPKTAYKDTQPTPVKRPATPVPAAAAPVEKPAEKPEAARPPAVAAKAPPAPAVKPTPAPPQPTPAPSKPSGSKHRFTVQVGAFKDLESADRMVKSLRDKGFNAYHLRVEVPGKGVWFRVRVGAFDNRPAAEAMLKKIDKQGFKGMVVNT